VQKTLLSVKIKRKRTKCMLVPKSFINDESQEG
jgi:hypothetical protein